MAAYIAFGARRQASADRGDHDGSGHAADGQDAGARDRAAARPPAASKMPPVEKEANILGPLPVALSTACIWRLNVGAMLISFLALLALVNAIMGWTHIAHRVVPLQPARIFWLGVRAVAWLIGFRWHDAATSAICWARAWCSTSLSLSPSSDR